MDINNSLLYCRPHIAKYLHPIKNFPLTAKDVSKGSGRTVWWICDLGHVYDMPINNRVKKEKMCPFCTNKRVNSENSLLTLAPEIAKQWHPTKNKGITPKDVYRNSNKLYWWICNKGHEYKMKLLYKQSTSCPYCLGKRVSNSNSLNFLKPTIAKQWHPTKNRILTPDTVTAQSNKIAWWICPIGHEFKYPIHARKSAFSGCKRCFYERHTSFNEQIFFYYLQKVFPNVYNRYIYTTKKSQSLECDIYIPSYSLVIEYDGYFHGTEEGHKRDLLKSKLISDENLMLVRIREKGLPSVSMDVDYRIEIKNADDYIEIKNAIKQILYFISSKYKSDTDLIKKIDSLSIDINQAEIDILNNYVNTRKINNLLETYPLIANEWNYKKNGKLRPEYFYPYSHQKVWWKCNTNSTHEWKAPIANRTHNGNGCPYCTKQYVTTENSLATRCPEAVKLWNYRLNKELKPEMVFPSSQTKVWWTCKKGHDHYMAIQKKTESLSSCPYCSGKKACLDNSLASLRPDLLKEWHYEKNHLINPKNVTCGSKQKVWWRCLKNPAHIWEAAIEKRKIGRGCPYCSGRLVDETNSLKSLKPIIAKQWHPLKNNGLTSDDVTVGSAKRVWWICNINPSHEWQASINSRKNNNCPVCLNKRVNKSNSLSSLNPWVCNDWDYNKNKIQPDNVVPGSGKKVWWKCKSNHEVFEPIRERVKRDNCRICRKVHHKK